VINQELLKKNLEYRFSKTLQKKSLTWTKILLDDGSSKEVNFLTFHSSLESCITLQQPVVHQIDAARNLANDKQNWFIKMCTKCFFLENLNDQPMQVLDEDGEENVPIL